MELVTGGMMRATAGRQLLRFLSSLVATIVFLAPASVPAAEATVATVQALKQQTDGPFSMAISGGISLGSYEAGLNWALLKYKKELAIQRMKAQGAPDSFVSVAGASAGGINTFFSAVSWCMDENLAGENKAIQDFLAGHKKFAAHQFGNDIQNNLFRQMWLGVGFDTLLPDQEKYGHQDGLLSRQNAFGDILDFLSLVIEAPIYRSNCNVNLGIVLTGEHSKGVRVQGEEVGSVRYVVNMKAKTEPEGHSLRFQQIFPKLDYANILILPGNEHGTYLSTDTLKKVVQASSAFPWAFSPVPINYCEQEDAAQPQPRKKDPDCPDGYITSKDVVRFVDGGVFDNVPLRTARTLAEITEPKAPIVYLYMDPDNTRDDALSPYKKPPKKRSLKKRLKAKLKKSKEKKAPEERYGLVGSSLFLRDAIKSARTAELYNEFRSGRWGGEGLESLTAEVVSLINKKQPNVVTEQNVTETDCNAAFENVEPRHGVEALSMKDVGVVKGCLEQNQGLIDRNKNLPYTQVPLSESDLAEARDVQIDRLETVAAAMQLPVQDKLQAVKVKNVAPLELFLTSRYSPVTGSYFMSFGAFMDESFRTFDYYAGVYDGIMSLAKRECLTESKYSKCFTTTADSIGDTLGLRKDQQASDIYDVIHSYEFNKTKLPLPNPTSATVIAEIFNDDDIHEAPSFHDFINTLKAEKRFKPTDNTLKEITSKSADSDAGFAESLLSKLLVRARSEEVEEDSWLRRVVPLLNVVQARFLDYGEDRWNQSHAPGGLWSWLPWQISTDMAKGGVNLAWEPIVYLHKDTLSFNPGVNVGVGWFGSTRSWYNQIDLPLAWRTKAGTFGLGGDVNYVYDQWRDHPRFNGGPMGFWGLGDTIRFTFGMRSVEHGGDYYAAIGLLDVPGTLYAIVQALH